MKLHWHAIQYVLFLTYFLLTDENALALPTRSRTKSNNFLRSENRVDGDSDVNAGTGQEAGWCIVGSQYKLVVTRVIFKLNTAATLNRNEVVGIIAIVRHCTRPSY